MTPQPTCQPIQGRSISLRPVEVSDAQFILSLRLTHKAARQLSSTQADLEQQQAWLQSYKKREALGQEHYFIIQDQQQTGQGLVRIYDLKQDSFCWGSWIIHDQAPAHTAIESALLIYEYGFGLLDFPKAHFDVRKSNPRVLAFHQRLGAQAVAEDTDNIYFNYTRAAYLQKRPRYQRFLPPQLLVN